MKDIYAVGLGVAAFAAGCATIAVVSADKVNKIDAKFTGISAGIKYLQDNIDLTIPEEVAEELTREAAKKVANDACIKASEKATKEICKNIDDTVKKIVSDSYTDVKSKIADKLEKEINIQTIGRIEQSVAEKVAKQVMNNYTPAYRLGGTTKADIVQTCIENGMDGIDIQRVMSAIK